MSGAGNHEINALIRLSARLGTDPLLVQAGTGNTSIKADGVLWVKGSGRWLANAGREEMFVPVDWARTRRCALRGEPCTVVHYSDSGIPLASSIETAMHALVPHTVTVHIHSVNTIAWAVRRDGASHLSHRLNGLPWQWVPYCASGIPLAQEVARAFDRDLDTRILVLANHGLVVCGDSCSEVEGVLAEVERRIAIEPRPTVAPDMERLRRAMRGGDWHPADSPVIHSIATDGISHSILANGILYPCQPIFLGSEIPVVSEHPRDVPFLAVEGAGTLLSDRISHAELEILTGLAEVVRRIGPEAPLRYLTATELTNLMTNDAPSYAGAGASR